MLRGQRDRLPVLWPTAERAASCVAARSYRVQGDRAHARARATLDTVLCRTSWNTIRMPYS